MRELRSKAPVGLSYLEGHTMRGRCLLTLGDCRLHAVLTPRDRPVLGCL